MVKDVQRMLGFVDASCVVRESKNIGRDYGQEIRCKNCVMNGDVKYSERCVVFGIGY